MFSSTKENNSYSPPRKKIKEEVPESPHALHIDPKIVHAERLARADNNHLSALDTAMATSDFISAVSILKNLHQSYIARKGVGGTFTADNFTRYYLQLFPTLLAKKPQLEMLQTMALHFVKTNHPEFCTANILRQYYANQSYIHNINQRYDLEIEALFNAIKKTKASLENASDPSPLLNDLQRYCGYLYTTCIHEKSASLEFYLNLIEVVSTSNDLLNQSGLTHNLGPILQGLREYTEKIYAYQLNKSAEQEHLPRNLKEWNALYDQFIQHIHINQLIYENATGEYRTHKKKVDIESALRCAIRVMQLDTQNKPDIYFTRLAHLNAQLYMHARYSPRHEGALAQEQLKHEICKQLQDWLNKARALDTPPSADVMVSLQKQYNQISREGARSSSSATGSTLITPSCDVKEYVNNSTDMLDLQDKKNGIEFRK